jgi:hypothetical protein
MNVIIYTKAETLPNGAQVITSRRFSLGSNGWHQSAVQYIGIPGREWHEAIHKHEVRTAIDAMSMIKFSFKL